MASGGGNAASNTEENMDTAQKTPSSKITANEKRLNSSVVKTETSNKEENDVVSQTRSGSAPVSVISSAQSLDPSKKDSG